MQHNHKEGKPKEQGQLPAPPDGIFECPLLPKEGPDTTAADTQEKLAWADAMMPMIREGVVQFSWVTLAARLEAREILAVKCHVDKQAQSLFHACARKRMDVLKRTAIERGPRGKKRQVIYIFLREYEGRMPFGSKVYGQGPRLARTLLASDDPEGIKVADMQQADALRYAVRIIIAREHPEAYAEWRATYGPRRGICTLNRTVNGRGRKLTVALNAELRRMIIQNKNTAKK